MSTVVAPFQDLLALDERARINRPAGQDGHWQWCLTSRQMDEAPVDRLAEVARNYGHSSPESAA